MAEIDTSSGGSLAERLARLKSSKHEAPPLPPKPPRLPPKPPALPPKAPAPPPRTNTSTSLNGRQPLPPPFVTKPKPPPLPSRSQTIQPGTAIHRVPPVFATKSAVDLGDQTAECGSRGGNVVAQMADLQLVTPRHPVPPVPPLPSRNSTGTSRPVPPLPQLPPRKPPSIHGNIGISSHQTQRRTSEASEQEVSSPRSVRRLPPPPNEAPPPLQPIAPKVEVAPQTPKNGKLERPPPVPANRPPPVNLSSRPSAPSADVFNAEMAACLICRDFKRPDAHAARPEFDRMRATSISGLALSLTEPFSDTIDKARVIFTWLHHNVAYDADGFFARNIGPQGPENTMRTGLAVCDGYAQLYKALANAAGLKCEKVSGFGAGFGFTDKNLPSEYKSNHAWNAILFPEPHGWHLIDSCWGAGVLGHDQKYCKKFNPSQFISSPKDFGKRHFPGEARWQCILNPISYAQFASPKPGPKVYGGGQDWKVHSITPWVPALPAGRVRIELERSCAHLKAKKGGQAEYLICAWTSGTKRPLPFREVDQFGTIAVEIDVNSGDKVNVGPLTTINGKDAKGVTADEWISQMNRAGWGCNSYLVTYGHD